MTVFERIKFLSDKQGESMQTVAESIGLSKNIFYRWKTTEPKGVDLQKVADYFNVSVDYLLGRTDNPNPVSDGHELNWNDVILKDEEEEDLIAAFRLESEDMTEEDKKKFNKSLKGMMKVARGLLNDDSNWKE